MKLNDYTIKAEYAPALIITIYINILLILHNIKYTEVMNYLLSINIETEVFNFSAIFLLWFILVSVIRYIAKHKIEKNQFNNGLDFPTTKFLLSSNNLKSKQFKNRIYTLLKQENGFILENLNSMSIEEEKKILKEQVNFIIPKVYAIEKNLSVNALKSYGFFRNLMGGVLMISPILAFEIIFFLYKVSIYPGRNYSVIEMLTIVITMLGVILFFKRISIINNYAEEYADKLLSEYSALNR